MTIKRTKWRIKWRIKCSIILVYHYIISFEKWILYSISVSERFIIVKNKTNVLKDKHTV